MDFDSKGLRAVVFDYGNTLIEFSISQTSICDGALADTLEQLFGPVDIEKFQAIRDRDRRAPYTGEYLENDTAAIFENAIRLLYGREPSSEELARVLRTRYESFVSVVTAPEYLHGLLGQLSTRYRLGLLSNYPDGKAIRATLDKIEVTEYFGAIVVSGEIGHVKPHPLPFQTTLNALEVAPEESLYVGDNWLGDIQGAKRAGMRAALITQWETPEKFDRQPGDVDPDVTISRLTDLLAIL